MKRCSKCGQAKNDTEFYRDLARDKPTSWCKQCSQLASKSYYSKNKEMAKASHRQWVSKNRDRVAMHKAKSTFGLTQQEWDEMPMICVICGTTQALCVDHSHQSGRVRGRLCGSCNKGLGFFRDNPSLLLRASDYVLGNAKPEIFKMTYEEV